MIKAVVFDLGGVLFAEGKSVIMEKLARERGYEREVLRKILSSPESIDLRKGLLSDEAFWGWAQRQLPEGYDALLIKKEWYNGYVLDEDILGLIKKLRGKYKIIAFSGNIRSRVDFLEGKYGFRKLFDLEVYSFDCQLTKPQKRFAEVMIEKSGCRPEEIIYIDDNEEYARPARELGVWVVLYERGKGWRLQKELQELGLEL